MTYKTEPIHGKNIFVCYFNISMYCLKKRSVCMLGVVTGCVMKISMDENWKLFQLVGVKTGNCFNWFG